METEKIIKFLEELQKEEPIFKIVSIKIGKKIITVKFISFEMNEWTCTYSLKEILEKVGD